MWFANIFSHSVGCLFALLTVSFDSQKVLTRVTSSLSLFVDSHHAFGVGSKNPLPNPRALIFSSTFSSMNFIGLAVILRVLIHLEIIFVHSLKERFKMTHSIFEEYIMMYFNWNWIEYFATLKSFLRAGTLTLFILFSIRL